MEKLLNSIVLLIFIVAFVLLLAALYIMRSVRQREEVIPDGVARVRPNLFVDTRQRYSFDMRDAVENKHWNQDEAQYLKKFGYSDTITVYLAGGTVKGIGQQGSDKFVEVVTAKDFDDWRVNDKNSPQPIWIPQKFMQLQ